MSVDFEKKKKKPYLSAFYHNFYIFDKKESLSGLSLDRNIFLQTFSSLMNSVPTYFRAAASREGSEHLQNWRNSHWCFCT